MQEVAIEVPAPTLFVTEISHAMRRSTKTLTIHDKTDGSMYSYASHLVITVDDEVQTLVQDSTISFYPLNDEFELVVKYYE